MLEVESAESLSISSVYIRNHYGKGQAQKQGACEA